MIGLWRGGFVRLRLWKVLRSIETGVELGLYYCKQNSSRLLFLNQDIFLLSSLLCLSPIFSLSSALVGYSVLIVGFIFRLFCNRRSLNTIFPFPRLLVGCMAYFSGIIFRTVCGCRILSKAWQVLMVFLSFSIWSSLIKQTYLLTTSVSLPLSWWCERCLLITESPKTPGHYRYLIWVFVYIPYTGLAEFSLAIFSCSCVYCDFEF